MSLTTFFNVVAGKYSDEQIREAAAAYYGRTAAAAAVAAVNNDITVNVNIDGETVKQFKPESPKAEQPDKQPKQPDKKPESSKATPPKPEKQPEPSKTTPPKQPEPEKKQPEPPKAEQPDKKPESSKATPPKQPEPEKKQPEPPKAEQPAKKSEQQDVTAQQAAHPVTGFNIGAFTQPPQMVSVSTPTQSAPIQQSQPMPAMPVPVPVYPANYRELTPEQRCDHLVSVINRGLLPPMHNPRPDLSIEKKVEELKKHITFMDMPGRQIGQVRIDSLITMIGSASLKNAINKNDAVDRANNPKLSEVPVGKYATGDQIVRFDMAFEIKLKDPKKILVVLYSTVPSFDPIQNTWSGDLVIFVKEI